MENPENVGIYKQHWDTYEKQPQLMEKLRLENPVMHHLLIHFRSLDHQHYIYQIIYKFLFSVFIVYFNVSGKISGTWWRKRRIL